MQPAEGEGEKKKRAERFEAESEGRSLFPGEWGLVRGPPGRRQEPGDVCRRGVGLFPHSPPLLFFNFPLHSPCHLEPPCSLLMLFLNVPPPRSERSHISPSHTFAFEKRSSCPALGCLPFMSSSYKRGYKTRHGRNKEANESIFQIAKHMVGN